MLAGGTSQSLVAAYDPLPPRRLTRLHDTGSDPFSDPGRPLRLTLSGTLRWLPTSHLESLLGFCRYPGIEMDAMPGLPRMGYEDIGHIDGPVDGWVTTSRVPTRRHAVRSNPGLLEHAGGLWPGAGEAAARRLTIEAAIHQALGNDYLVCEHANGPRSDRRIGWSNDLGACSVDEALAMVGAKARMFRFVPLFVSPGAMSSVNVGRWRELAVRRFVPHLARAIIGASSPSASDWERASLQHLQAMRARLLELLIVRDVTFRMARSDSLARDSHRYSFFNDAPIVGESGGDLLELFHYHLVAGLNAAFTIGDNLAWVIGRRAGVAIADPSMVGLARALFPRADDKTWRSNAERKAIAAAIQAATDIETAMALRKMRNLSVHRDGLEHGRISHHPSTPYIPEVFGVWIVRGDARTDDLWQTLARLADFVSDDVLVITYRRLVSAIWRSTTDLVAKSLVLLPWSSTRWIRTEDAWKDERQQELRWDHWSQERLWDLAA